LRDSFICPLVPVPDDTYVTHTHTHTHTHTQINTYTHANNRVMDSFMPSYQLQVITVNSDISDIHTGIFYNPISVDFYATKVYLNQAGWVLFVCIMRALN